MADNTAAIAALEEILNNGATSVTVDGETIHYDFDEIRRRLRELRATDDDQAGQRPRLFRIDLTRAF